MEPIEATINGIKIKVEVEVPDPPPPKFIPPDLSWLEKLFKWVPGYDAWQLNPNLITTNDDRVFVSGQRMQQAIYGPPFDD